jgi:hypothetical protein
VEKVRPFEAENLRPKHDGVPKHEDPHRLEEQQSF